MSRFAAGSLVLAAVLAAGCGSKPGASSGGSTGAGSTPAGGTPSGSAGSGSGAPAEGPQAVTRKGTILDFNTKKPVVGAVVTAADQTAKSAADGTFSIVLQKGEKHTVTVTMDGYAKLIEQETSLQADYDEGKVTIVPDTLASMLTSMLTGYDATLGVLSVAVVPTGGCASEDGSTLSVTPEGSAQIAYFNSGVPSSTLTAVKGGQFPSAVIYNVAPGVPLHVEVKHATCKEAPFPFQQGGVDYTGGMATEAGTVTGFARIFLQ